MVTPLTVNNIYFDPMVAIESVIRLNVPDINPTRAADPNPLARQWIFPTTPEANDEKYPRIAIIPGTASFSEYGTGRVIEDDFVTTLPNPIPQNTTRYYGRVVTIPITIGVFVKKKQSFTVTFPDTTSHSVQNSRLADYLGGQIAKVLEQHRNDFIQKRIELNVTNMTSAYEDNEFLWGKNIELTVQLLDVWAENFDPAALIAAIDLACTVNLTTD